MDENMSVALMYDELKEQAIATFGAEDAKIIDKAFEIANAHHEGQKRSSGEPYIIHPVAVAKIVLEYGMDCQSVAAAMLHDTVEDTDMTLEDVKKEFGAEICALVDGLTKLGKVPLDIKDKEEQQAENVRKMLLAMSEDIRVIIIKLADRLHNIRTLNFMPPQKRRDKAVETLEIYAPIAHRLGIRAIKEELEDKAISYLDPIAYKEIEDALSSQGKSHKEFLETIKKQISDRVREVVPDAKLEGRIKSVHGIYRKMYMQNRNFDEIYDIYAVRIIVDNTIQCYDCLGIIHDMFTPIPGRFKDYISTPKPNMYQSLHTTVVGPKGTPFEIQIRTWDMHKVAEEGIAAHWKYKEGVSGQTDMDSKLEWVRQLLENQKDIMDTDEFLNNIKLDLFNEEVFAITPNGKVISLANGSTVIDFAFAIHTQVGCKMSGAKVNGKIVPHDYKLKNGDIVEILTSPSVKGPSRDWLKIVKTSQARTKINQWLKKECREENIVQGKEYIEKECRRINVPVSELFKEEWLKSVYKKYNFNSIDDLYASVGYGGLTAQKVVLRLNEEYQRLKKEKGEAKEEIAVRHTEKKRKINNSGVEVIGIDNCLVRLSGCCNPVPGDDIVGFITKGRGVSVHRADCANMQPSALSADDRLRFIPVEWSNNQKAVYVATLTVETEDKPGMMMAVTAVLTDMKINCVSIEARVTKNRVGIMNLGLEISDSADVKKAANKIRQIPGVISVSRTKN